MAQFKDYFSGVAAQYAAARPQYPEALFDYLAGQCGARRAAWDCACGSGQASLALAARFDHVIATDASAQQIAAASAHPRVQYRIATAEDCRLAPQSLDLVSVAQALHWFDLRRFYGEVERVLRPGGVLAVWTYGRLEIADAAIAATVRSFSRDVVGPYWPAERAVIESGYRSLPFPYPELTPPPFVIETRWPLARLLGYFRSWSATTLYVEKNGTDPVPGLGAELASAWGDPQSLHALSWPLMLRVGRKPS